MAAEDQNSGNKKVPCNTKKKAYRGGGGGKGRRGGKIISHKFLPNIVAYGSENVLKR